jgi:hypothetical protein
MSIVSISQRHFGTQQTIVNDNNGSDTFTITLDLSGCMIHVRHRLPSTEEISTINSIVLHREIPHGIHHNSLIKLQTSYFSNSLI